MLHKQFGKFVFECDGDKCHESLETDASDFNQAQAVRAKAGWRSVKDGQEWLHLCEDCKHDY